MALAIPGVIAAIAAGLGMRYLKEQAAAERKAEESIQKINQSAVLDAVKSGGAADWTPETWQAIVKQGWGVSGKKAESVTNPLMLVAQTVRAGQQRAQASQAQLVAQFLGNQPQGGVPTQAAEMEPARSPQTGQPIRPLPTMGPGAGVAIPPTVAPVAAQAPAFGAAPAPVAPMPAPSVTPAPQGAPPIAPGPPPEGAVSPAGALIQELGGRRGQPNVSGTLSVKDPVTGANLSFTRTSETPADLGRRLTTIFTNPRGQYRLAPMGDLVDAASAVGADVQNDDLQRIAQSRLLTTFNTKVQEQIAAGGNPIDARKAAARELVNHERFIPDFLKQHLDADQHEVDRSVATAVTNTLAKNPEMTAITALDSAAKAGFIASSEMKRSILDDHARTVGQAYLDTVTKGAQSPLERLAAAKAATLLTYQHTGGHLTAEQMKMMPETPPLAQDVESELRAVGTTGATASPQSVDTALKLLEDKRRERTLIDQYLQRYGAQALASGVNPLAPGAGGAAQAARIAEEAVTTGATRRAGLLQERPAGGIPTQPSEGAITDATQLQNAINVWGRIKERFKPEYVGPIAGRVNRLGEKVGLTTPEAVKFRQDVQDSINVAIFALSGKQVGQLTEAERLQYPLPNVLEPDNVFKAKLDNLLEKLDERQKTSGAIRRSVGEMAPAPTAPSPSKKAAPTDTDMVTIGGRTYFVPKTKAK